MYNNEEAQRQEKWLAVLNQARNQAGLGPIKRYVCKYCKRPNLHLSSQCDLVRCFICGLNHSTKNCMLIKCPWCGQLGHYAQECKTEIGIDARLESITTCPICKKKGHSAVHCTSKIRNSAPRTRKRYSKRGYGKRKNGRRRRWKF